MAAPLGCVPRRLLGECGRGAQLGELAALHLVDEHVAALDIAVGLEVDLLRNAAVRRERLDVVEQLRSRRVAGLDALDEDVRGVITLARVRARVLSDQGLVLRGEGAQRATGGGRRQLARARDDRAFASRGA